MNTLLRVLLVEDSEDDAALLVRVLRRGGYDLVFKRVDTAIAMTAALEDQMWDLIISDYIMPQFSGPAALNLLKEKGLDLPFIIVSGKIGEDVAVEAMKAGAHDYIIKGNLVRLLPAVKRELHEAEERRARRQAEEALTRTEREKTIILENMCEHMMYLDKNMKILWANRVASELLDLPPDQLVGHHCHDLWPAHQCAGCPAKIALATGQIQKAERGTPDGKVWLERAYPVQGKEGDIAGVVSVSLEITEQKKADERLRTAHQQLMDIIEFLPDATIVVDRDRKVIAWNRAIEEMTGVRKEDITGKGNYAYSIPFYGEPRPILIDLIFAKDSETVSKYDYIKRTDNKLYSETFVPEAFKGEGAYLWATASPLFDGNGKLAGAIETIRDITARKRMENQLQHMARHDFLTNTPNRYALEENLKKAVAKAGRGEKSALLFFDLDNFKIVNDTLGHSAGDEVLITLANLLKVNLREEDLLFRFGGDEFAVLMERATVEEAVNLADRLRLLVGEGEICLAMYKTCFNLTISVGIVMLDGTIGAQRILTSAGTALYSAKEKGRNRVVVINPNEDNRKRLSESNQLVGLIKNALKDNRFRIYFQPIVNTINKEITHYEVLLRLEKENGEIILSNQFIPIAESFGLMPQIDRWVIQKSLEALEKEKSLRLFINLSGTSLGDDTLLELIDTHIHQGSLDPSRIGFELTETAAVKDMARANQWVHRIKKLGCSFALDDFGIGFSSFPYLSILPVDYIKIDGSFVRDIDTNSTHRAIVEAINAVAHTLGKKTIAEYVENENILNILLEMNIDFSQGYYLGKPDPNPHGSPCLNQEKGS